MDANNTPMVRCSACGDMHRSRLTTPDKKPICDDCCWVRLSQQKPEPIPDSRPWVAAHRSEIEYHGDRAHHD